MLKKCGEILAEICAEFYEGLTAVLTALRCLGGRSRYVFGQWLLTKRKEVQDKLQNHTGPASRIGGLETLRELARILIAVNDLSKSTRTT